MFAEHKYVYFPNQDPPTYLDDQTYCQVRVQCNYEKQKKEYKMRDLNNYL